ncbi:MAG: DUF4142 domain-containing protein [Pseudomonadota bacterium]
MSWLDRVLETAAAVAAVPVFMPNAGCRWPRRGLTPLSASSVSAADAAFAVEAAELGLAEVLLSRLAAERGQAERARAFARRMVEEHSAVNTELAGLCATKRIAMPAVAARGDRDERDRLDALPANAFDAAYAARMVADHERAVALFRLHQDVGADADLRALAARVLPSLEQHLAAARTLAPSRGGRKSGGKSSATG